MASGMILHDEDCVFQVTDRDVEISATLGPDDIGKWIFIRGRVLQGLYEPDEIEMLIEEVFRGE